MRYGADGSRTLVGRGTHWQRADDHSELALKIDLIVGRWKANDTVGRKEPMRHTLVHQRLVRPDIGYTQLHGGEVHLRANCRAIEPMPGSWPGCGPLVIKQFGQNKGGDRDRVGTEK